MGMVIFWLVLGGIAFIVDILTSNFCFVLLAAGSIAAAIGAGAGLEVMYQIIIYAVVNVISISIGYPWLKKKYKKMCNRIPLMEEKYIGKIFEADKEIKDKAQYKVGGEYWTLVNCGEIINVGDKFEIIGIEGIKFIVKKYNS
ncbi:MAG: NfeD family protein [Clostridium butyricum]|nr:NfeD family protein [Clostridium butyricum]